METKKIVVDKDKLMHCFADSSGFLRQELAELLEGGKDVTICKDCVAYDKLTGWCKRNAEYIHDAGWCFKGEAKS